MFRARCALRKLMDISHLALLQYLEVRCIPMAIARSHTKEVHFEMGNQNYFAIGLKNTKGGWELRNRFQKLCSSPKAISHFNEGKENLAIVEILDKQGNEVGHSAYQRVRQHMIMHL